MTNRNRQVVRCLNILVSLRQGPRTLAELAHEFEVTERTIRRDLYALCEVPFPIICSRDDTERSSLTTTFALAPMTEWPKRELVPRSQFPARVFSDHGGYVRVR